MIIVITIIAYVLSSYVCMYHLPNYLYHRMLFGGRVNADSTKLCACLKKIGSELN